MHNSRSSIIASLSLFLLLLQTELQSQTYHFYKGRDFGSESLYSPWGLILNGSYDIIQLDKTRDIFSLPYSRGFKNVTWNLGHPFSSIESYGWHNFIRDEIFPLSLDKNNGQWYPNYTLHLIGGGMTYRAMAEWFTFNDVPSPYLFSFAVMGVYHMMNEVVENQNYQGRTVDPISDIYLFDLGGIALFSSESVCAFFDSTLNLADWSLQPSFLLWNRQLHNNGQYFSLKWKLPFWDHWYLHHFFGLNDVTGLSYRFDNGEAISFGYGLTPGNFILLDRLTNKKTISLVESAGIFFDRDNSLLASMLLTRKTDYTLSVNIYPGFLDIGKFKLGGWIVLSKNGETLFGVTTRYIPGVAF